MLSKEAVKQYHEELEKLAKTRNFGQINDFVMSHTYKLTGPSGPFASIVENSLARQRIINEDDSVAKPSGKPTTNIIVSSKRTFEAARAYQGKKVAVLNFASNHSPGGAPYYANAQEECLCRESTLYRCLLNEEKGFYQRHQLMFKKGEIDDMGNADLIYTPDVMIFKSDESVPHMLEPEEWYSVDVITCAAPQLSNYRVLPDSYFSLMQARIDRILDVAESEGVEVLILGAFGCGVYNNPPEIVGELFKRSLARHHFDLVEFAVYEPPHHPNGNYQIFTEVFF